MIALVVFAAVMKWYESYDAGVNAVRAKNYQAGAEALSAALLHEGIVWLPNHMNYICLAHSESDIERFVAAASTIVPQIIRAA